MSFLILQNYSNNIKSIILAQGSTIDLKHSADTTSFSNTSSTLYEFGAGILARVDHPLRAGLGYG